jgi:hypothetical protein
MNLEVLSGEIFGIVRPASDAHSLGISAIAELIKECGYPAMIASSEICQAVSEIVKIDDRSLFVKWIYDNAISRNGFIYRLDPEELK